MRVFSFAQESTRYCNYHKDKFGKELTFIIPTWLGIIPEGDYKEWPTIGWTAKECEKWTKLAVSREKYDAIQDFFTNISQCQMIYMGLIGDGFTPQQARQVLPNSLKTELIMTGFTSDWDHFFDLRARGTTGAPHPDAKALAEPLMGDFYKRNLV